MNNWIVIYELYSKAVEKVCAAVQPYLDYSLTCTGNPKSYVFKDFNYISLRIDKSLSGYRIKVGKSEHNNENQCIELIAKDDVNLLYAAADFKNKYLPYAKNADQTGPKFYFNDLFKEPMKEYDREFSPRIERRGLWSWGFVIFDYKRYIDNMVSLKLNTLIIWNDFPPVNSDEIISYAHERGVKIYFGFAWGWDNKCEENETVLNAMNNPDKLTDEVLDTYEKQYAKLDLDGIYFQSFTEMKTSDRAGIPIAEAVTKFVNNTVSKFFDKFGQKEIMFGLHATSVKDKLDVIAKVDSRVSIIWEDCGAFPYDYIPKNTEGFEETLDFTRKIRDLRSGGFGVVLKGLTCLDWGRFKHQCGEFALGVQEPDMLQKRAEQKNEIWKYVQAWWLANAGYAYDTVKQFKSDSVVTMLAEDGAFESQIPYPMALLSEMLWDSNGNLSELMCETALREDVTFA